MQRTEAGAAVAEREGLLPPKHDAGTATRHYRAFWQRRCRAADAGAVLKPQGGNCAVLPLIIIEYRINYRINRKQPQRQGVIPHRCGYFICRFVWFICRARCPHRAGENHKPFVTNLQTICRGRWALPKAIPHNSKCRYGERGAAAAKPKAQIILDAAKVSAASGGNSEPKQGQRSQSARSFCPRSTMRVPQPDIIEHFGNADAVPQLPEQCLSRKAGIVRCCPKFMVRLQ